MLFFFDVETTGLPARRGVSYSDVNNWPRIVSISWTLYETDQSLVAHKYAVIRPEVQRVLDRLTGVPVDIEPRFVTKGVGHGEE